MNKKIYNKLSNPKQEYAAERLAERGFICISNEMKRWCKNFINRTNRRKGKQNLKKYNLEDVV